MSTHYVCLNYFCSTVKIANTYIYIIYFKNIILILYMLKLLLVRSHRYIIYIYIHYLVLFISFL
ncbi:hypothetical protein H8356DRAFT_1725672, partial [Neocallimastix lanati (nom. inval.)]